MDGTNIQYILPLEALMLIVSFWFLSVYTILFSALAVFQLWAERCWQPHRICQLYAMFFSYRKTALIGKAASIIQISTAPTPIYVCSLQGYSYA